MSRLFVRTIDKLKRIDRLVRLKATGPPNDLANKINVSPSTLYEYLLILKDTFHAPIVYCKVRRSYHYKESGDLGLEFKKR